jgi:uncharacterized membrane protein
MPDSGISRDARSYRLDNIDMLRGLVIIFMAIDHVRDFLMLASVQDPMAQPDIPASIYLTRWVTHFCAPVFVFLAGTSAGLMSARKTRHELAAFLCKRGVWLIFVEVFVISTAWTFSPFAGVPELGGHTLIVLQVIWAIGASMIVLAGCQYLGARACLVIGALVLLGHNSLDSIWPTGRLLGGTDPLWYGLMTCAFFVIRATGLYGDPNPWQVQDAGAVATVFDFMNVTKYPPSLLFLLATLGPMTIVCAYGDRVSGWLKDALVMFGRVPFAFYVAHWYLLRLISFALAKYQGFELSEMMNFFFFFPKGYGVTLVWVYVFWFLLLAILYPFCKWVADVKTRRKDWWLSYL